MLSTDINAELVAGVYHHLPHEHALERRCRFAGEVLATVVATVAPGGTLVGLSSVHWREAVFRYCQHDAGHVIGSLRLAAWVLGWRLRVLPSPSDALAAALLGHDRRDDFAGAEPEHPDVLMLLDPTGRAAADIVLSSQPCSVGRSVWSRQPAQPGARAMASNARRRRGCREAEGSVRRRTTHAARRWHLLMKRPSRPPMLRASSPSDRRRTAAEAHAAGGADAGDAERMGRAEEVAAAPDASQAPKLLIILPKRNEFTGIGRLT